VTKRFSSDQIASVEKFAEKPEDFLGGRAGFSAAQVANNPFGDYAPQSTQITGILQGMYDAFTADLEKDNAEEGEKEKAHRELMATKATELKTLEATLETTELNAAAATKTLADSKGTLDDTKETLEADEAFFKAYGEPLFSSHMLDLSEEPDEENIGLCATYFKKMQPMNLILEMEIGITGGVEDGVDNSGVSKEKLYSTPEDVFKVHTALSPISEKFTIAAAFGNVHGVYKAGNVKLQPDLLNDFQKFAAGKLGVEKPLFFVFHGGSGSLKEEIDAAVSYGVVKMNVDTDTQWAYWEGILNFYKAKEGYLQGQIGNPEGADKPNKSYYDPRKWVREAEVAMCKRVEEGMKDLKNTN